MRYTKEKSLKSRRPNEKASEMKGRIARGLLSVALVGVLTTIMPFNANANSSNVYYLGEAVNAGKDTGFSENNEITKKDPHYNWTLGSFSVNGYTRVITDDGNPIFLKTVGDEVVLDFQLEQDIDALNNDKSLMIANDKKAYDNLPAGSTQEIVLDVRGRGFSKDVIDNVVANIQSRCAPVYKDIPVTVMSY